MNWATKYRPRSLDDVIGQPEAVTEIKNTLKSGDIPGFILISGQTGSGKTTLAYLIAHLINGLPNGTLPGDNPDLLEYNIGELSGVDDVRNVIIKSAKYRPRNKYRVVLLDEFHLASRQAMSALLKPLEEPPPQTVWVACTTEPEKLLNTGRGRALRLSLNAPEPKDLMPLLQRVCKAEKVKFGSIAKRDKILMSIAQAAYGQPREAVNALQPIANTVKYGGNVKVAMQDALRKLSVSNENIAIKLLLSIYRGKVETAIRTIADVADRQYVHLVMLLLDFNKYLLDLKVGGKPWHSEAKRELVSLLPEMPSIEQVLFVHDGLVNMRVEQGKFLVQDWHLLPAHIGKLTLKLRNAKGAKNG